MIEEKNIPILCTDIIFKSIFIDMESIIIKFIYDITGYKLDNIILTINEIPITRKNEKFKRSDFIIKSDNEIFNIELNSNCYNSLIIKNLSYLCGLFSKDTNKGEDYNDKLEVIQININNYSKYNKPVLDYQMINNSYGIVYFNGLKIYDLDIVKCRSMYYNENIRKRNYLKWGALFSSNSLDEIEFIIKDLIGIRKGEIFMSKLKKMTVETYVMDEAEALREDDKIRRSIYKEGISIGKEQGISIGKEEGIEQGILTTIKNMIKNSASYEFISKVTGKSINEIKELAKDI